MVVGLPSDVPASHESVTGASESTRVTSIKRQRSDDGTSLLLKGNMLLTFVGPQKLKSPRSTKSLMSSTHRKMRMKMRKLYKCVFFFVSLVLK